MSLVYIHSTSSLPRSLTFHSFTSLVTNQKVFLVTLQVVVRIADDRSRTKNTVSVRMDKLEEPCRDIQEESQAPQALRPKTFVLRRTVASHRGASRGGRGVPYPGRSTPKAECTPYLICKQPKDIEREGASVSHLFPQVHIHVYFFVSITLFEHGTIKIIDLEYMYKYLCPSYCPAQTTMPKARLRTKTGCFTCM